MTKIISRKIPEKNFYSKYGDNDARSLQDKAHDLIKEKMDITDSAEIDPQSLNLIIRSALSVADQHYKSQIHKATLDNKRADTANKIEQGKLMAAQVKMLDTMDATKLANMSVTINVI
jgi:hypothetical protein